MESMLRLAEEAGTMVGKSAGNWFPEMTAPVEVIGRAAITLSQVVPFRGDATVLLIMPL
ncbi:MAG: hypothetical protein ABGZ17_12965 [Planctomycetaceae bacterium]|jgi:hypothetical protein